MEEERVKPPLIPSSRKYSSGSWKEVPFITRVRLCRQPRCLRELTKDFQTHGDIPIQPDFV